MDKERAINALKAVRMSGYRIDATLVRSLAVRHGWEADAADRLEELATKIGAGRAVKGGGRLGKARAKEMVARFEADPD